VRKPRELAAAGTRTVLVLDTPRCAPFWRLPAPYVVERLEWTQMINAAARAAPSSVVLLDALGTADGTAVDPRVPALLAATRMVPVVALVPFQPRYADTVRALLAMGVCEVADAELECTPEALHGRLACAHAQSLKRIVEPALSPLVSASALTLIRAAADVAVDRGSVVDLGRVLGANERTVSAWCARASLPPGRRLLAWLRLILAVALLEDRQRPVANAAASAGYREWSLRRALREFLGGERPPRERTLAQALAAFNAELREIRERALDARRTRHVSAALERVDV
jgi:hypothetical protein